LVDGNPVAIETGEELGDIRINLDAGQHNVILDFLDTPTRRRWARATLISAVIVCFLLLAAAVAYISSARRRPAPKL
jgi:hypothetical protein